MHSPLRYTVGHVPGDLLDLILIVLVIAFGVAGYRQGFIIGVLSFAGFIGGGAIGALFGPRIARAITANSAWQAIVAILVVFLAAMIGQLLASAVGRGDAIPADLAAGHAPGLRRRGRGQRDLRAADRVADRLGRGVRAVPRHLPAGERLRRAAGRGPADAVRGAA